MKHVKVLQLDWWMPSSFESGELWRDKYLSHTYFEVFPEFNRDGIYMNDQRCWFEIGGKAFKYDRKTFEFDLKMLSVKPLRKIEYEAFKVLRKAKLLSRKEKEKLWNYENWVELRKVRRDSAKYVIAGLKNFKEEERL